ncbi:hypothetical protein DCAR_0209344 [Daucus carota subsp. sativus]|uniref:Uncharacterized protein n=1 Tax=Daucus carota subsp. sativus TaxID=79200 RepID=A0A166F7B9_DAUCS|nr:PREDICTED: uncharacterized protein LOC108208724 [Daucus carota subsp. sativus]WOG90103.1 hypothetical protein DCAR_0209344 [Daucus carota subsp. sativus]
MGPEVDEKSWPEWAKALLAEKFFDQCELHSDSNKNECNLFCLDCYSAPPICSLCVTDHEDHPVIQIRRSSYHDVIRVSEIERYLDTAYIQTYVINGAKVVFLNKRPQLRPSKGVSNTCVACDRGLLDNFRFCSLGCKITSTSGDGGDDSSGSSSNVQGFSPSTPPTALLTFKSGNRRKGKPRRAPTGGLIMEK